jgi:hypothetical protein
MAGPRPGHDDFQTRRALRVVVNLSLVGRSARMLYSCATALLLERMIFALPLRYLSAWHAGWGVIET